MGVMALFVWVFFYPAFVFTILLAFGTYLPGFIQNLYVRALKYIMFTQVTIGGITLKVFHFIILMCSLTFLHSFATHYYIEEERVGADWRVRKKMLVAKFRAERNYWITLFTLCLWILLIRFRHAVKESEERRSEIAELNTKLAANKKQ